MHRSRSEVRMDTAAALLGNAQSGACLAAIPDFPDRALATQRLLSSSHFSAAKHVFVTPDASVSEVPNAALARGKAVTLASPRLETDFLHYPAASGKPLIDLLVTGSIAVNHDGYRLGKGLGYFDLEYALLSGLDCLAECHTVATVISDSQLVEDSWDAGPHDVQVNVAVTPSRTLVTAARRPAGGKVMWELVPQHMLALPPLRRLRMREAGQTPQRLRVAKHEESPQPMTDSYD